MNLTDIEFMKLALRLAKRGQGRVSPNPMVGAVIVKNGRVIGQGYHHYFGGSHAEIDAIEHATEPVSGSKIYVTLEPCSHHGKKTPPCTEALIREGIKEVIAATLDSNPKVNGKGLEILRKNGIKTSHGLLEKEARELNPAFFKLMQTGRPLVTLKYAQTLDGRIAAAGGSSQWISGPEFRKLAHRLRANHDAVLVGVGTVIKDDPELTVRLVKGRNPLRIVVDSSLRIPIESLLIRTALSTPVLIACTERASLPKIQALSAAGVEVILIPPDDKGEVNLEELLDVLGKRGISSVLIEGGSGIITAAMAHGLADRLVAAVAPKIMGRGIEAVGDLGIREVSRALALKYQRVYRLGEDIVIQAEFDRPPGTASTLQS